MALNHLPALNALAAGRDHITTREFAYAFGKAAQTVRKNYCLTGVCYGIRPIKVGKHLLWPVDQTESLLNGGA
jgi:hypothetical protein